MGIQIVEVPANSKVNRFGPTFSIWEGGDFWRNSIGSRRAWSTLWAAQTAVAMHCCPILNKVMKKHEQ
jgi:hypothetical protein